MTGYSLIIEIERLKEECDKLGFRLGYSKMGSYKTEFGDVVALFPKDQDALPIYSRDAEIFIGTISDLKNWLRGVTWARDYDRMVMGNLNDKRRERKEQDRRNQNLIRILSKE